MDELCVEGTHTAFSLRPEVGNRNNMRARITNVVEGIGTAPNCLPIIPPDRTKANNILIKNGRLSLRK